MFKTRYAQKALLTVSVVALSMSPLFDAPSMARDTTPSLIITSDDLPPGLKEKIYTKPVKVREIRASDILPNRSYQDGDTLVGRKVNSIGNDLFGIQGEVSSLSGRLARLQDTSKNIAAEYYANIATISTQLQSGTTPGNPRLVKKIEAAELGIESLSANIAGLNELAIDTAHVSSEASFLLEETRASYGISGAVEEDHVQLAKMEDSINNTIVLIERLLNNVNDDITRTSAYLNSERHNLRTLSLAVANGDLYGKNLAMRPFSSVPSYSSASVVPPVSNAVSAPRLVASESSMPAVPAPSVESTPIAQQQPAMEPSSSRPLAKIRFDKQDVEYEQPIYMAVSQALERYPNSSFDLVAVQPARGNAAQKAIESTRSRRNAERVLRTLTQMGLPLDRINLSYNESENAQSNEVHLYMK